MSFFIARILKKLFKCTNNSSRNSIASFGNIRTSESDFAFEWDENSIHCNYQYPVPEITLEHIPNNWPTLSRPSPLWQQESGSMSEFQSQFYQPDIKYGTAK